MTLLKILYTSLEVFSGCTIVINLAFSQNILMSKKKLLEIKNGRLKPKLNQQLLKLGNTIAFVQNNLFDQYFCQKITILTQIQIINLITDRKQKKF